MFAHIPSPHAPSSDIDTKLSQQPVANASTPDNTLEAQTPSSPELSVMSENATSKPHVSVEETPSLEDPVKVVTSPTKFISPQPPAGTPPQAPKNATSPTRSQISHTNMQSSIISPVHSAKSANSPANSVQLEVDNNGESSSEKARSGKLVAKSGTSTVSSCDSEGYSKKKPFEAYQDKIIQLCRDLGWGEPSTVERMKGGSYNRIVGLTFKERQPSGFVLRISRTGGEFDEAAEVKDQVSLLQYLSTHLPVAGISAFDSSQNNALSSSYVLQECLPGIVMDTTLYKLSLVEKLQITEAVAEVIKKMESIKFDSAGRLSADASFPSLSHAKLSATQNMKVDGFRYNRNQSGSEMPPTEKMGLLELFHTIMQHRAAHREQHSWMSDMWLKLQEIASQMEKVGFMRMTDTECSIWHWDFAPRNIMMRAKSSESAEISAARRLPSIGQVDMPVDTGSPKSSSSNPGCHHKATITVDSTSRIGSNHTINFSLENPASQECKHKVSITVEDSSGTAYKHTLEINSNCEDNKDRIETTKHNVEQQETRQQINTMTSGEPPLWEITGILDWDLILSLPLVLARSPPLWLWCNEDERSDGWTGNMDVAPARELTQEELLIKAHFDQIMAKHDPSYMEDAYYRGPWLRRLARFALFGFGEYGSFDRYDNFIKEWEIHYSSITKFEVENISNNESDEESGEDEESVDEPDDNDVKMQDIGEKPHLEVEGDDSKKESQASRNNVENMEEVGEAVE